MTTLLLVPAGETDLQVVIRHAGEERRTTVAETRVFHESLLNGEDWVVDEEAVQIREFEARGGIGPDITDCLRDTDGRIRLVPAKLKYVLDRLERVTAAVIFSTQRDPEIFRSEPAAAGPVLAGWIEARNRGDITLARELALQRREPWDPAHSKWPGGAQWVNLLQGRERLEGSDPVQRPLAQELVRRLHLALARLQEDLRPSHVIIARTGGFPALKELIVQVANLIFGSERVEIVEVPQHSNHLVRYGAYLQKAPQEAYRLREAALARIRKGDLEGAASFAERVLGDEWEQHWAEPVIVAADWLAGRSPVPAGAPKYLTRLNIPLRCFWAAARAQAALRAGRIQEAVINSVTFWDTALLDAIQRANWVSSLNEIERELEARPGHKPPDVLLGPHESRAPLTPIPGRPGCYWYHTHREHVDRWLDVLDEPIRTELKVMQQALDDRRPAIRNYRNAAVHGRLVRDDRRRAETEFKVAGVWSNNQPPRFLYNGGPAVRVLRALGVSDPLSIVEGMFKGLEKEILLPPG
ncbi:MAG: hypothetical protein IMX00_00795 [Limnochordales bacterium]|nr:hypothetical protein [Limnochordales bacterium]